MTTIQDEIVQGLGIVPNFFPVSNDPQLSTGMWRFARAAYVDNPLPPLFKERLFVWLARLCPTRHLIARHVGYLLGVGRAAGDRNWPTQSVEEVVRLLTRPMPTEFELRSNLAACAACAEPLREVPEPDSPAEARLFACAAHAFLSPACEPDCVAAFASMLGPQRSEQLLLLLAFIHSSHCWARLHPSLGADEDVRQVLASHPELSRLLSDDSASNRDSGSGLRDELESLRQNHQRLVHDTEERLQQNLADSRLLHEISNELISEQCIDTLYDRIIDAAVRLMHASGGSMQLVVNTPEGGKGLGFLRARGLTDEALQFWHTIRPHDGTSCGQALVTGQRVVVPDVANCDFMNGTRDQPMLLKCGVHAMQTTPLYSRQGRMLGAMSTYWLVPHEPTEHQLQMLDILARQTADLIERTQVEEALRASEDRFRRALQPKNVGILFFDTSGKITDGNDEFLRMSGYDRADLEAGRLRWDRMTPPEWMEDSLRAIDELKTKGWSTPYEKEYVRKDGARSWALFAATQLGDDEGVEFVIDITGRKQAEQALLEADRRKDLFLATLAHELRNPLAPVSNALHLLRQTDGRRKADTLVEMISRQVRHMVRLVDDLLEVSRIASGKIELNRTPTSLSAVVQDAIETSQPLIEEGRHTLQVALPPEPVWLDVDGTRLTQVLSNLLNNAAKYTNAGGRVWLTVKHDGAQVEIAVRDDGIGIAPEQLPSVFDLFVQVHKGVGRNQGGLGIGLTMSRSLVEMHGGTIEARSAGIGHGSEFVVRIPALPTSEKDANATNGRQRACVLAGQRLLVVDDNRDAADSLGMLLQLDGAEVRVAYAGLDALAAHEEFCPDAILLDLGMAEMDGYEVARQLRSGRRDGLRIVALTGWGQDSDRIRTRSCGFDLHLTKPVDIDALKAWLAGT